MKYVRCFSKRTHSLVFLIVRSVRFGNHLSKISPAHATSHRRSDVESARDYRGSECNWHGKCVLFGKKSSFRGRKMCLLLAAVLWATISVVDVNQVSGVVHRHMRFHSTDNVVPTRFVTLCVHYCSSQICPSVFNVLPKCLTHFA